MLSNHSRHTADFAISYLDDLGTGSCWTWLFADACAFGTRRPTESESYDINLQAKIQYIEIHWTSNEIFRLNRFGLDVYRIDILREVSWTTMDGMEGFTETRGCREILLWRPQTS